MHILKAVEKTNDHQHRHFFNKIKNHFNGNLKGKALAIWGVAFKPGTDDIREAQALKLIENLLNAGSHVRLFDPVALEMAQNYFGAVQNLHFVADQYSALEGAEALIVATEWKIFREPAFEKVTALLKSPVIFDGRNIFSPKKIKEKGFTYYSVGRPS